MLTINHDDEFEPRIAYRFVDGAFEAVKIPRTDYLAAIKDTTILQAHNAWGPKYAKETSQAIDRIHSAAQPELANRVTHKLPKVA